MVVLFKARPGKSPAREITRENLEELLGRRAPWFKAGQYRGDDRHFAVCPYCDNPIQLKGLYRRQSGSPRPYGSHCGHSIEGFPFDRHDLEWCPYKLATRPHPKSRKRSMGPSAQLLIDLVINEFDRIVLLLRQDFGFAFSNRFASRMLEQWLDSQGYLYTGAHPQNLPWMIAYFAPAMTLFGQPVAENRDLATAIAERVPQAAIQSGRLARGAGWFRIELQCLHHKAALTEAGDLEESLTLRVQDFTATNEAGKAPTLYSKPIVFTPARFEALIHTPAKRAVRNPALLEVAREIAERMLP